jgi:hypothetical protein
MSDETTSLPHLGAEFLGWLWFATERDLGTLGLEDGSVDVWVDDRISFRSPEEDRPRTVLTGDNPGHTLEARAALAGGKLVRELRLGFRREEREYLVTLSGPSLEVKGAKLPPAGDGDDESVLYDRMFFYEELHFLLRALLLKFAKERCSEAWFVETLPAMRSWVGGASAGG